MTTDEAGNRLCVRRNVIRQPESSGSKEPDDND
jgi:hypothetical protein